MTLQILNSLIVDANLSWEEWLLMVIIPLIVILVVAALIGLERQNVGKAAGLSAHILVGLAACGLAIMQRIQIYMGFDTTLRVVAQVVTGVGFIGAGVILKDGKTVRGITTAATIWATAGIGLILGSGFIYMGLAIGGIIIGFIYIRDFIRGMNPFVHIEDEEHTRKKDKLNEKYRSSKSLTSSNDHDDTDYTSINI